MRRSLLNVILLPGISSVVDTGCAVVGRLGGRRNKIKENFCSMGKAKKTRDYEVSRNGFVLVKRTTTKHYHLFAVSYYKDTTECFLFIISISNKTFDNW